MSSVNRLDSMSPDSTAGHRCQAYSRPTQSISWPKWICALFTHDISLRWHWRRKPSKQWQICAFWWGVVLQQRLLLRSAMAVDVYAGDCGDPAFVCTTIYSKFTMRTIFYWHMPTVNTFSIWFLLFSEWRLTIDLQLFTNNLAKNTTFYMNCFAL